MIVNVRDILKNVDYQDELLNNTEVEYDYKLVPDEHGNFSGGLFAETIKKNIPEKRGDSYLVGFIITINRDQVLTQNGLFVNINQCKATNMLILPTFVKAVLFVGELIKMKGYSNADTNYIVCAAYQHKNHENSVTCVDTRGL